MDILIRQKVDERIIAINIIIDTIKLLDDVRRSASFFVGLLIYTNN